MTKKGASWDISCVHVQSNRVETDNSMPAMQKMLLNSEALLDTCFKSKIQT